VGVFPLTVTLSVSLLVAEWSFDRQCILKTEGGLICLFRASIEERILEPALLSDQGHDLNRLFGLDFSS
jgi:hypothetical protein